MTTKMTTKERILIEALTLFSEKGFDAVSVEEIAQAVGIKAPSLYKHYKGKQEIFDSCVNEFFERMTQVRDSLMIPGSANSNTSYETADINQIIEFSMGLFMFYLKDEIALKFRKMLAIERYRSSHLNIMYESLFVDAAVEYEEKIFSELIKAGIIKDEDPHIIALRFYSPIFYLLQKYEMHPGQEDIAKQELIKMVHEFCETYKGNR